MCRVRRVSTGTATTPTEGPAPGADVDQASGSSSETSDTPLTMAVTVSATALPAAVVNHMVEHTQAIEPHAVIEIQETEQISLPENSAGIALIKTPTIRGNNDVDPVILTGDFGKVVKLKSERSLTDNEIYLLHMFVKNFELDIIKRRWFLGLCPLVNIIIRPPPFQIPVSAPESYF